MTKDTTVGPSAMEFSAYTMILSFVFQCTPPHILTHSSMECISHGKTVNQKLIDWQVQFISCMLCRQISKDFMQLEISGGFLKEIAHISGDLR